MKLYIIGNGFDIAHGLHTGYDDYREFVRKKSNSINNWSIIEDYYPGVNNPFWSDIENKICLIDINTFLKHKRVFGFSNLDLLLNAIHNSFESFIIDVEQTVSTKKRVFELDENAYFLTFNYTTTLETIYNAKKVIHIHNEIQDAVLKNFFKLDANDCVIGHSPIYEDFSYYSDPLIGSDKDYIQFREKTTKDCKKNMKKNGLLESFLMLQNVINEVVFYGFSFSESDRYYMQYLFATLQSPKIKVYYYVKEDESEEVIKKKIKSKVAYSNGPINSIEFINCKGITKI